MSNSNARLLQYVKTKWGTESPSSVVEKIAQGNRLATEALAISPNTKYRSQLVQAGAIDKLLTFLIKTDKPFREVLEPSISDDPEDEQISCPSVWLNVLNNFCQDGFLSLESQARDVQYKIIINMGPLVQDMSNFETRELFGDRDIWIKSLMFFSNILFSLLSSNFERIGDFLLKQKLLQTFMVRTLYLQVSDPQIVREIKTFSTERDTRMPKPDIAGTSATFCACGIKALWTKRAPKNPTLIEKWAGTPIRPEHELGLMTGIIPLLQVKSHGDGWYEGGYSATLSIFIILFDKADRLSGPFGVDSVSEVMVDICRHHLIRYAPLGRDRFFVENILTGLVTIGATIMTPIIDKKQAPVDYSVAKAIRAGFVDYLIECCDANDPRVSKTIEGSIRTLSACFILKKTRSTMEEMAPTIRAKIERIQDRHPVLLPPLQKLSQVLNNPMIKAAPLGDCCAFCQEKVAAPAIKKCTFCKTEIYCSKKCERLNWMIHQMDCAKNRVDPVAQSPEKLMEDGKRFFSLHVSKLLLQASLKGFSILDGIVVVDMCEYTPLLKIYTLEQFSTIYIQDEEAVGISEKVLQRNKNNGALTVSFVGFSDSEGFNGNLMTFPPSTAPDIPLVTKAPDGEKWMVAQKLVTQSSLGQAAAHMQKNPRVWQAALMKTMKP